MNCVVCGKESSKPRSKFCCEKCKQQFYYQKNKEQRTEYKKQYYQEHREEYLENNKKWVEENREKRNEYRRKRRKELKENDSSREVKKV